MEQKKKKELLEAMVILLKEVSFKHLTLIFYFLWIYISYIYLSLIEFIYISTQSLTILFSTFLFVQLDVSSGQENKAKVFSRIWSVRAVYSLLLSYIINFSYLLITITLIVVVVVVVVVCVTL